MNQRLEKPWLRDNPCPGHCGHSQVKEMGDRVAPRSSENTGYKPWKKLQAEPRGSTPSPIF